MEHEVHTIQGALTELAVAVGRLDEQMKAMRNELLHHTSSEHKSFDEALEVVDEIKSDVKKLQDLVTTSKGAWWILAKIGAILLFIVALGKLLMEVILSK